MVSVDAVQLDGSEGGVLGKEISQEEWDAIEDAVIDAWFEPGFDLGLLLNRLGYSSVIRGIQIKQKRLARANLSNCHFIDCDLTDCNFSGATIANVTFTRCDFRRAIFYGVQADGLYFSRCNLSCTCWNRAQLNDFGIDGSDNPSSFSTALATQEDFLEGMTLLGSKISGYSFIKNCSLKNIIFSGNKEFFLIENCTPHVITRPVIGIGLNTYYPGVYARKEVSIVQEFGGIPVFYNHYPEDVDPHELERAVFETLQEYPGDTQNTEGMSRAQWILSNPCGKHVIEKVINMAQEFFPFVDGLVIPGGDDVPEVFYTSSYMESIYWDESSEILRSVFEFALLDLCERYKKPALGICRGCQIMNVFLNGTLRDIWGGGGPLELDSNIDQVEQELESEAPCLQFIEKIKNAEKIYALSLHDQAADCLGATVLPILWSEGVLKFALAKGGLFILSQVHPEVVMEMPLIESLFTHREDKFFLQDLKRMIEGLDESSESELTVAWIAKRLRGYALKVYKPAGLVRALGLDGKSEPCTWFSIPVHLFWDEQALHQYFLENKDATCFEIERLITMSGDTEQRYDSMIDFAFQVFNLFFEQVGASLLPLEETA